MSTETKRYRLIRDWEMPNRKIPAGSIYVKFTKTNRSYFNSKFNHFVTSTSIKNTEWFELIPEQSKMPKQEERIKVGKMSCNEIGSMGYGNLKWTLQFRTNKHIHYDKAIDLCNLLERYLNGEMDNPNPTTDTNTVSKVKELERLVEYYEAEFNANSDKIYTQQEVDAMMKDVWEAARAITDKVLGEIDYKDGDVGMFYEKKYNSLNDYKNTLTENKASTNTAPKEDAVVKDSQTKSDVLFTEEQYKEIWDMIFSQTGFPPYHPKTKRNK